MEGLKERACKAANKVSLNMLYGETTDKRDHAGQMIEEAFDATSDLLGQIHAADLRDCFEQFQSVFANTNSKLDEDPVAWSRLIAAHCDSLHKVGLHQKTIASVGDELAKWNRQSVSHVEFCLALNGLAGLVTVHADLLTRAIEQQAGHPSRSPRRTLGCSHGVCGLAIVLIANGQAIEQGDPLDENCAAMSSFGASLTVSNVNMLCRACELPMT